MATLQAAAPLVPIEELKAFVRVTGSEEDSLLAGCIRASETLCEAFTRLTLIEREVEEDVLGKGGWARLERSPVRAILDVEAIAEDGSARPLPADGYAIDIDSNGDGWVRAEGSTQGERLRTRYRAGIAQNWNGVPEPLRHGVLRMAAHFYAHRSDDSAKPPASVAALWRPYRRLRLG
jgi:uncharacterized phiE125 gp8 family phage protein